MKLNKATFIIIQCLFAICLISCRLDTKIANATFVNCTESDSAFNGDLPYEQADIAVEYVSSNDSLPVPTNYHYQLCFWENIKILITTSSSDEFMDLYKHDYFILKEKKYIKVNLSELFNENKKLLLEKINAEFERKLLNSWTKKEIQDILKQNNTSSLFTFEKLYMSLKDDTVVFSPIIFDEDHQSFYEENVSFNINEVSAFLFKENK